MKFSFFFKRDDATLQIYGRYCRSVCPFVVAVDPSLAAVVVLFFRAARSLEPFRCVRSSVRPSVNFFFLLIGQSTATGLERWDLDVVVVVMVVIVVVPLSR